MDQEQQRILADDYLDDLGQRTLASLRTSRGECQVVETKLSYLRRLVQGHHDIVTGELDRRRGGGSREDVAALVDRLPEILSDRIRGPGAGRLPASIEPGELSGALVERLHDVTASVPLDGIETVSDEELDRVARELADLEVEVSSQRRAMFDRIDAVEAELTRRYRDGEANVDDLLGGHGPAAAG